MRSNKKISITSKYTHEGAPAGLYLTTMQQLRRSVMSCMLFEREFYEDGEQIADRIIQLAHQVDPEALANLAIEARHESNLRHVPLLLLSVLVKTGSGRADGLVRITIASVISRADEIAEFVAMYWRNGKKPLSAQMKKGLAAAFSKFDRYQLARYNRKYAVKLRDVMFLTHPKPGLNHKNKYIWRDLANNQLKSPDTWEVSLSAGKDKRETFTRLLKEGKLGYLALLRNLRNMVESGVEHDLIEEAIRTGNSERALPFRFIAAARACPQLEFTIDQALLKKLSREHSFNGDTIILVDVSLSMCGLLSSKSDLNRMDAAASLASIFRIGRREKLRIFTFSNDIVEVPRRYGMAGIDAIVNSQKSRGTDLGLAVCHVNKLEHDRLIVITDEQSQTRVPDPVVRKAYMVNVASNENGVGYGPWTHIDGFSENVLNWMHAIESDQS